MNMLRPDQGANPAGGLPPLEPGNAVVLYLHQPSCRPLGERLCGILSADERARAERFRVPAPRDEYLLARGLLRRLLGHYLELPPDRVGFRYGSRGKPALDPQRLPAGHPGLRFNLSHAGDWIVYALARDRELGVDIEALHHLRDWRELSRQVLTPRERAAVEGAAEAGRAELFLRVWTGKEAYLKGRGDGLATPLTAVEIPLWEVAAPLHPMDGYPEPWWIYRLPAAPGYAAALAVAGDPVRVETAQLAVAAFGGGTEDGIVIRCYPPIVPA